MSNLYVGADPNRNLGGIHTGNWKEPDLNGISEDSVFEERLVEFQAQFMGLFDTRDKMNGMQDGLMNTYYCLFNLKSNAEDTPARKLDRLWDYRLELSLQG